MTKQWMVLGFTSVLLFSLSLTENGWANVDVGLADGDITPAIGVPLAGYGSPERRDTDWTNKHKYASLLKPSVGILDPIRAKVMVLRHQQRHLVFVNLDLIAADKGFRRQLLDKLRDLPIDEDGFLVSATHTHSGPGAISKNPFWQVVAVDTFKKKIFEKLVEQTATIVRQAMSNLQPAELWHTSFEVDNIQKNRRGQSGNFDRQAHLLLAKNQSGQWFGGMINFALHPISLRAENLLYSADNAGAIEREVQFKLQELNSDGTAPVMMMINGAEGDVRPAHFGVDGLAITAQIFSQAAMTSLSQLFPVSPDFSWQKSKVRLGMPAIHLAHCLEEKEKLQQWFKLQIPLSAVFPSSTEVTAVRLGELAFLTWPGEPITEIGRELKAIGHKAGASATWVMGLTNEHLSYFVSEGEWVRGGYEACANFYGPTASHKIIIKQRNNLLQLFTSN